MGMMTDHHYMHRKTLDRIEITKLCVDKAVSIHLRLWPSHESVLLSNSKNAMALKCRQTSISINRPLLRIPRCPVRKPPSLCPWPNLPVIKIIREEELQTLNLPLGVQNSSGSPGATVSLADTPYFGIVLAAPDASCKVSAVLIGRPKPISTRLVSSGIGRSSIYILLEKSSTLCCLFMSSFIKGTQVCIDCGGWNLRSEDHNVERVLFPSKIGGCNGLFQGLDDFSPLSYC